jgi:hypothetical protein
VSLQSGLVVFIAYIEKEQLDMGDPVYLGKIDVESPATEEELLAAFAEARRTWAGKVKSIQVYHHEGSEYSDDDPDAFHVCVYG